MLVLWLLVQALRRVPALRSLVPARAGKVHASLAVGPRERVVLVEMANEWLLLGVAPGRVSFLKSMDPESARRWLESPADTTWVTANGFNSKQADHAD